MRRFFFVFSIFYSIFFLLFFVVVFLILLRALIVIGSSLSNVCLRREIYFLSRFHVFLKSFFVRAIFSGSKKVFPIFRKCTLQISSSNDLSSKVLIRFKLFVIHRGSNCVIIFAVKVRIVCNIF